MTAATDRSGSIAPGDAGTARHVGAGLWIAVALAAALAVIGDALDGARLLHYVAKPLATALVATWVWRHGTRGAYRSAVLAGLALSLGGDVALMLPVDVFAVGLGCFLLAHIAYLVALRTRAPLAARRLPWLAYALVAAGVLAVLWPHLPPALRLPVLAYVVMLAAMAAQAAVTWRVQPSRATAGAALGGACFVMSDALLAFDRFVAPWPGATALVLATYWMAQAGIARSTRVPDLQARPHPAL